MTPTPEIKTIHEYAIWALIGQDFVMTDEHPETASKITPGTAILLKCSNTRFKETGQPDRWIQHFRPLLRASPADMTDKEYLTYPGQQCRSCDPYFDYGASDDL